MATVTPHQAGYLSQFLNSKPCESLKTGAVFGGIAYMTGGAPFLAAIIGTAGTTLKHYFEDVINESDSNTANSSEKTTSWERVVAKWSITFVLDVLTLSSTSVINTVTATGGKITQKMLLSYLASAATGIFVGKAASGGTKYLMSCLGFSETSQWLKLTTMASEIFASGCAAHLVKLSLSSSITEQLSALSADGNFITQLSNATHIPKSELQSSLNDTTAINNTTKVLSQFSEQQLQRAVRDLSQDAANNITNSDTSGAVAASGAGGLVLVILAICGVLACKCCGSDSSSN